MDSEEKLWTPNFIVLTCANFLTALVYYLIAVKIVEYTMLTYGVAHSVAGSMVTSFIVAAIFARIAFGSKIDAWGPKRASVVGAALIAIASGLYLVDFGMGFLYAIRIIHGIGFGIETGALAAAAALMVPAGRRGEGIGYFSMSQALATGIGPMIGMMLMNAGVSFFAVFALTFAMSIVALAGCCLVRLPRIEGRVDPPHSAPTSESATTPHDRRPEKSQPAKIRRRLSLRDVISMEALPLCSVMLLVMMGYSVVVSFMALLAEERDLTSAASFYFLAYSIAVLVSRPPMGRRVDRKGENSVMYLTLSALTLSMVVLAFSHSGAVLLASALLLGLGVGASQSTVQACVPKLVGLQALGKGNSTFFICMDAGYGIGPITLGSIIPLVGYQTSFILLAGLAIVTIAWYHIAHGRKASSASRVAEEEICDA